MRSRYQSRYQPRTTSKYAVRGPSALGEGVGGIRPANNVVAFGFDSRTLQGQASGNQRVRSYIHWLRLALRQKIRTTAALNFGISGQRSDQVLTNISTIVAALVAAGVGTLYLLLGTNDIGSVQSPNAAASSSNIDQVIAAVRAVGIVVVCTAETPRPDLAGANLTHWQGIHDHYVAIHNPANGVYTYDPSTVLADNDNRVEDGVHLSVKGNRILGYGLAEFTSSLFPANDILPADNSEYTSGGLAVGVNIITNALMSGGTTVATGYTGTNNLGGTTTATFSKVSTATGAWQQTVVSGTPAGAGELFARVEQNQDARANLFGNGDILDGMVEVEVDDGVSGVQSLELVIVTDNTPSDGGYDGSQTTAAYILPATGYAGVLRILPRTLSATPTTMRLRLRAMGIAGVPMAITFRCRKAKITKLAA